MVNDQPLVSVLMTAYNREKYIAEAIESVLASSYKNFELIIVDDASIDSTVEIASTYAKADQRIKIFCNENNIGDYPNRNKAASYASGIFLMFVDSDDRIFKDGINNCVEVMINYPNSSFGMYFSTEEKIAPFYLDPFTAINNHFFKKPFLQIGPGGTIMQRRFFNETGGYPVKYGPANDMYFNLKAASVNGVILLPFDFIHYRIHEGQEINNHFAYLYNGYSYMTDAISELNLPVTAAQKKWLSNKAKRRFFTNICSYYFKTFNGKKTSEAINRADYGWRDALQGIFH